jgi:hypothetical protein
MRSVGICFHLLMITRRVCDSTVRSRRAVGRQSIGPSTKVGGAVPNLQSLARSIQPTGTCMAGRGRFPRGGSSRLPPASVVSSSLPVSLVAEDAADATPRPRTEKEGGEDAWAVNGGMTARGIQEWRQQRDNEVPRPLSLPSRWAAGPVAIRWAGEHRTSVARGRRRQTRAIVSR